MTEEIFESDVIYPPEAEQVEELKTHNVGFAVRLAMKLGRPLEDLEYEMFRKEPPGKKYKVVALPNERFGII
jgi:hypothetical protein